MKKIVDSNPAPEEPKVETIPNPAPETKTTMTATKGGGAKKDNTALIVVIILIIVVIGIMIYKNMNKPTNGGQPATA